MNENKVISISSRRGIQNGGNNGGGGGKSIPERLSALEADIKHLATKEDIQKVKVWILAGVLGGIFATSAVLAGVVLLAVRLFVS